MLICLKQREKSNPSSLRHPCQDNTIATLSIIFLASLSSSLCVVVLVAHDAAAVEHIRVRTPQEQEVDKFL